MRIAVYLEQYSWGGVSTHLLHLLRGFQSKKGGALNEIVLFTNDENSGYALVKEAVERIPGVRVVHFPSRAFSRSLTAKSRSLARWRVQLMNLVFHPLTVWRMELQARRLIKDHGPFEVLISENGGYPAAWGCLAAIFAAKSLSIPNRILIVHHAATPPSLIRRFWEKWIDRRVMSSVTSLVAVSRATRETLYKNRAIPRNFGIEVVYNGIEIRSSRSLGNEIRTRFGANGETLIAIMGRIEPYKGHDDLIRALRLLPADDLRKLKILFIGKGEDAEIARLQELAGPEAWSRVVLTGYLSGEPDEILAQVDLLCVLTKDFEGFGLTLAEAMSVGTPVLATHVGAIPEFVSHLKTGYLVPPLNPVEVARAIKNFVSNRKVWSDRAKTAKDRIKDFSVEKMETGFRRLVANQKEGA